MRTANAESKSRRVPGIVASRRRCVIAAALFALAGCASIPKPLQGEFAPLIPAEANARDAT